MVPSASALAFSRCFHSMFICSCFFPIFRNDLPENPSTCSSKSSSSCSLKSGAAPLMNADGLANPWPPYFALTGCSTSPITLSTCLGVSFSPLSCGLRKSGMDLRSVRSFTALPARLDLNLNFSRNSSFHAPLFLRGGCEDFGFSCRRGPCLPHP